MSRLPAPAQYNPNLPNNRVYGPLHTGGYSNVAPQWSYDDLVSANRVQQVHDFNFGRDVWFYPTPQNAYRDICDALHTGFSRGLAIAWKTGAYDVAPGVFFPGKTWDQIVADSERVKQNLPEDRSNWNCTTLLIKNTGHSPQVFCDITPNTSVSSNPRSAYMPSNNRVVISTAAQWRTQYGNDSTFPMCVGQSTSQTIKDPAFGHSYQLSRQEQLWVNSDGTTSVIFKDTTGPILTEQYGKGGVSGGHQYTADSLRADIASGNFPRDPSHITHMFWNDSVGTAVTPAQVLAATGAGGAPPGAPGATDWGKYIGYGGIAVGGVLLLSALMKKD